MDNKTLSEWINWINDYVREKHIKSDDADDLRGDMMLELARIDKMEIKNKKRIRNRLHGAARKYLRRMRRFKKMFVFMSDVENEVH